jgi:hypothetical protein
VRIEVRIIIRIDIRIIIRVEIRIERRKILAGLKRNNWVLLREERKRTCTIRSWKTPRY